MAINNKAIGYAPHARTGKDGAIYTGDGILLASVESFTAQASMNNASYSVIGNPLELETVATHKITLTFTEVFVCDIRFINGLMKFFKDGTVPNWTFSGVVKGNKKGAEERMVYKNCIPSGQIDLQNITVGDVIKRNWSFAVNSEPVMQKSYTV